MSALWFVRHGNTAWSERARLQGWAPIGLSEQGVAEAHRIGHAASALGIRRILHSPLKRARDTARIVARHVTAPRHVSDSLRELDYGLATGCTMDELRAAAPQLAEAWHERPWRVRFTADHGALADLAVALVPLLAEPSRLAGPTLCITHGHVIRVALTVRGQLDPCDFWHTEVPAGSFWQLQQAGDLTRISA